MVYDEGFDITIDEQTFFAFSMYSPRKGYLKASDGKFDSHCYATLSGWYKSGKNWGCFYGKKKIQNPYQITNQEVPSREVLEQAERV